VSSRLPDQYFADMYAEAPDPWRLSDRWYEERKYALTVAMLPLPQYRHAFEPGCSVGVLTEHLTHRCEHVTATDVAEAALDAARARLERGARLDRVTLRRLSLASEWPADEFDLIVLSEVAYYLAAPTLRGVLDRECRRLQPGTTIIASHWRHPVDDYPLTGDEANAVIADTDDVNLLASYLDDDVAIAVFVKGPAQSVATRGEVPGARPRPSEEA
jgi:predicted TPR repeat methyltransferase